MEAMKEAAAIDKMVQQSWTLNERIEQQVLGIRELRADFARMVTATADTVVPPELSRSKQAHVTQLRKQLAIVDQMLALAGEPAGVNPDKLGI